MRLPAPCSRDAQAEIAKTVDVEPERLSPEKLFPRILENMVKPTWAEEGAEKYYWTVKAQNPEAPMPDLHLHLERPPARGPADAGLPRRL